MNPDELKNPSDSLANQKSQAEKLAEALAKEKEAKPHVLQRDDDGGLGPPWATGIAQPGLLVHNVHVCRRN